MPATLRPLQTTFEQLRAELIEHMAKEDAGLFPAIVALENGDANNGRASAWMHDPINMLTHEHDDAGAALAEMRRLTDGFAPPSDACPTFRGLYYGLSELEREMHVHVHLENHILFPRALAHRPPQVELNR